MRISDHLLVNYIISAIIQIMENKYYMYYLDQAIWRGENPSDYIPSVTQKDIFSNLEDVFSFTFYYNH